MNKIYVVEGIHDEQLLKRIDSNIIVITTNGLAYDDKLIDKLIKLEQNNEIILILDPDFPGTKIRDAISSKLKNPKHIFIPKHLAISTEKQKVGLEHVEIKDLKKLLNYEITIKKEKNSNITTYIMQKLGLTGRSNSQILRNKVTDYYHLPKSNAKRLLNYLNGLGITKEEIQEVLDAS